jgi:hypothetical protein
MWYLFHLPSPHAGTYKKMLHMFLWSAFGADRAQKMQCQKNQAIEALRRIYAKHGAANSRVQEVTIRWVNQSGATISHGGTSHVPTLAVHARNQLSPSWVSHTDQGPESVACELGVWS